MGIDLDFDKTTEPEGYGFPLFMLGAGAAAPVLQGATNVTLGYNSTGNVTITFPDDPGPTFLGAVPGFTDTSGTPTNSAGWSVVCTDYVAPSNGALATLTFQVANASNAAADLATTQKLALWLYFKRADHALGG